MPRLGGNLQRSYLVDDMNAGSHTLTMSSDDRDSFGGVYVHRPREHSISPPASGQAHRSVSLGSDVGSPSYSSPSHTRSRTFSTPTLCRTSDSSTHSEGSLRRRARLYDSANTIESPALSRNSSSRASSPTYMMQSSPPLRRGPSTTSNTKPRRLGHLVQCVVVFIIFGLVWDSHRKVEQATEQLLRYQKEESLLIAQMDRVENRARDLREHISNIKEEEAKVAEANSVEPALKTLRLRQELAHLEHEDKMIADQLKTLQRRIQKSARDSIVKMYGEGTIRVDLQLNFNTGSPGLLSLELSDHTPHAVWAWLQQLIRHDWNDAMFRWKLEHVVLATPARLSSQNYKLEFIERNEELNHEKYSVGLSQREDGGVNLYINLLDNGPYHENDVCIGKVVGGFGALNKLLNVPVHKETNHLDPAVSIRQATVKVIPPSTDQEKQKQPKPAAEST